MRGVNRSIRAAVAACLVALVAWGLYAGRCRVTFVPYFKDLSSLDQSLPGVQPDLNEVARLVGMKPGDLHPSGGVMLWPPPMESAGSSTGRNIVVELFTSGTYGPADYLVTCMLSGTVMESVSATRWEAAHLNGHYAVGRVPRGDSGTPYVVVAWLEGYGPRDDEHVRLLEVDPGSGGFREVWEDDIHSSGGGGVFLTETLAYSFEGLVRGGRQMIVTRKTCDGDECGYTTSEETWQMDPARRRFVRASKNVKR